MKKCLLLLAFALLFVSCKKENEVDEKVAAVPVGKIDIERFDKIFYESDPNDLTKVKQQFPYFFPYQNKPLTTGMSYPLEALSCGYHKQLPDRALFVTARSFS